MGLQSLSGLRDWPGTGTAILEGVEGLGLQSQSHCKDCNPQFGTVCVLGFEPQTVRGWQWVVCERGLRFWVQGFCMRLVMGHAHAEPHAKPCPKSGSGSRESAGSAVRAAMMVAQVRTPTVRAWQWVACEHGSHFWVRSFQMRLIMGHAHAEPHAKAPLEKRLRFERKGWWAV